MWRVFLCLSSPFPPAVDRYFEQPLLLPWQRLLTLFRGRQRYGAGPFHAKTMATQNFYASLKMTLAYEGGYSNHPLDPGAATMRGVTQVVYNEDRQDRDLPTRDVRMITEAEVTRIYRVRYWERVGGDELPAGLDYVMFDFAVNSGVRVAVRKLQGVVAARADGVMGPATLASVAGYVETYGLPALIDAVCRERMRFLRSLDTFPVFGKGWTARVMGTKDGGQAGDTGVCDRAMQMASTAAVVIPVAVSGTPKTYSATGRSEVA